MRGRSDDIITRKLKLPVKRLLTMLECSVDVLELMQRLVLLKLTCYVVSACRWDESTIGEVPMSNIGMTYCSR